MTIHSLDVLISLFGTVVVQQSKQQSIVPCPVLTVASDNNRMGKTRDLFKKIKDTKETFHAKMGTIKYRNGMDLPEAEDIKKRSQHTQKNYIKKIFITQKTTMVRSLT